MKKTAILKRLLPTAAVLLGAAALSGCSALNTGEEEFSCSGMPGSIYCASARDVYEATNDGVVPSPMRKEDAYNEDCEGCPYCCPCCGECLKEQFGGGEDGE